MDQINSIRDLWRNGYSAAKIAETLSVDEKTVRKYLSKTDFSPRPPEQRIFPSKLDPYKQEIERWLEEDKKTWHKQRHTAKRIHDRLSELHREYDCCYLLVQRYVKKRRAEEAVLKAAQELVWHPGETQADFGEADCYEAGELVRKKYLTLSFPFSNGGWSQIFGGEAAECVCQGLQNVFIHIAGVPPLVVFDNATGVGRRVGETVRLSELFARFRAHYGFQVRFCNPQAGHEKGNVEAKVGFTRRNLFVPPPVVEDIESFNRCLLVRAEEYLQTVHYKKNVPVGSLFADDRKALRPLPAAPFDVCRYEYLKADGYGKIRLDANHWYSTAPEYAGAEVLVAVRAHTIEILSADKSVLVAHKREYGKERTDSLDYRTSLSTLIRNAGAWKNCGIREELPLPLRETLDSYSREELVATLRSLRDLSQTYSFETAIQALELAHQGHSSSPLSAAAVLAARLVDGGLDALPTPGPDLREYDMLLSGGVN